MAPNKNTQVAGGLAERVIERRAVAALEPYARNPRKNDPHVEKMAALLAHYGQVIPILVDGDVIVDGHLRWKAARHLGWDWLDCLDVHGMDTADVQALRIALNKSANWVEWDEAALAAEIADLEAQGRSLDLTGFAEAELARLRTAIDETGLTDPDAVPEARPEIISRTGDLWLLGRHRLLCGDSTNPEHVARLMQGALADLCFTSPPYAQQRDYQSGGISDWDALMQGVFALLPAKPDVQVLVNLGLVHRDGEWLPYWDDWIGWMRVQGWRRFGWYVWDQGAGLPGDWNGRLAPSHEFVFHFNRAAAPVERARKTKDKLPESIKAKRPDDAGLRGKDGKLPRVNNPQSYAQPTKIPDSVIRVMRHKARGIETEHPAVFPVDLVSEMVTAFSDPDDVLYEPFCGSGTQLISAQKNGRTCCAMELAPAYVDIAVRRWQLFTGQLAKLDGDGRPFAEITEERLAPAEDGA